MTANYKILCDIGDKPNFLIGGQGKSVDFHEIEKSENLNRIYRFQFKQPPKNGQLDRVISAIKKRPEIELRFYGDYSEELIDWDSLIEIENLQIDLWETNDLKEVSRLRNLKSLGITKNVKSKVSLEILEPLRNLKTFYTSISKNVETISKLPNLEFLSFNEIKTDNLDFLINLKNLQVLLLSMGSFKDFSGLSRIENLQRLQVHQVRGFESEVINSILKECSQLWALKLDNLKSIKNLDFISSMPKIKYLSMEGIKNLDTYAPIKNSKTMETIAGYNCRPADKSLEGLINLKEIWLGDSYTKSEIERLLNANDAESIWIRGKNLKGTGKLNNPFDLK
ncbi:hypothetical protein OB69_06955 [Roseivirga seohaensis subsp. aquiponti]|uniref:Internalin n=1 Tax=Roseivirga seohaensis subsp. aquiponti TaxID=1566026 RepID=A0A0L8ALK8_9BACT|nr:hypothetical protein [Roseivirga seohaensis]KOF03072.1 hypothetical protein OB69_06955 [Roseivirga seohaensis subsp. aquiponti]